MGIRRITGAIKAPLIISWLFFVVQFAYMGIVHGIFHFYISLIDLIFDVVLLFIMEAIAVLLTLSNNNNSRTLFKAALFVSIFAVILIALSILIIFFPFFSNNTLRSILNHQTPVNNPNLNKTWIGIVLIAVKFIEISPLIMISVYLKKLDSSPGSIISPQKQGDGLLEDNSSGILE